MTKEETIEIEECDENEVCCLTSDEAVALNIAIKALEQEPCEDCISRLETIKYLNTNMTWYDEDGEMADDDEKLKAITDLVNGVPSACF